MSANADCSRCIKRFSRGVQGSKMSANADQFSLALLASIDVQGSKMSANADKISRDQKQLSDIFA